MRDWPGIPVAVTCPDPRIREVRTAHPLCGHLIVTASVFFAVSRVLMTPTGVVEWPRIGPHPTAPRASRNFVTGTLLDWGWARSFPASLVVSELVTNTTIHAGADIALSVTWSMGGLRLTVRDNSPEPPRQRFSQFDLHGVDATPQLASLAPWGSCTGGRPGASSDPRTPGRPLRGTQPASSTRTCAGSPWGPQPITRRKS